MSKLQQQITTYLNYCADICLMSSATLDAKRATLKRFMTSVQVDDISQLTNRHYISWAKNELSRDVAPSSMNTYSATILAFIKFHRNVGVNIPLNLEMLPKFKGIRPERKFYTSAEIAKVVAAPSTNSVTSLQIRIMAETGMRIAELAHLKVENINGRKITFIGKGRRLREVYMRLATSIDLRNYLEQYQITKGPIWCVVDDFKTLNNAPFTINTLRHRLAQAFADAGFPNFYPHALRHSFATNLQLKGASVAEIKEMMGHSSIATTERYLHGFEGQLKELFEKYRD